MKNPYDPKFYETIPRQTINVVAPKIGVTPFAMHKWYYKGAFPRPSSLQMLAKYMKCTPQEALSTIERAHAIIAAGHKLPHGVIIEKDMLTTAFQYLKEGKTDLYPWQIYVGKYST